MKKISIFFLAFAALAGTGCKKYLDINQPPNGPAVADPALYLASTEANYALGVQFDARALAPLTQNFLSSTTDAATNPYVVFDQHGYIRNSDGGGDLWRNVYWKGGQNTIDMINLARQQEKWDLVGIGLALQAWGWQNLTDYHGDIIVKEAFKYQNTFKYDSQDTVYAVVKRLALEAIENLNRADGNLGHPLLTKFDIMYRGNRTLWKRFAFGVLAQNAHHMQKKAGYDANEVIRYVDSSFTSNADDALVPFLGVASADANFFGPLRNNLARFGQSGFITRLMDGTAIGGTATPAPVDPRRPVMLTPSADGTYRGLTPYTNASGSTNTIVRNMWGNAFGTAPTVATFAGKYLFADKAPFPLMTYAMLQFIKAEAALSVDPDKALTAYKNGINAHMDFVVKGANAVGITPGGNPNNTSFYSFNADAAAFNAARATYLASPKIIPATAAGLTQSMILMQKYIALWGYGFIETWVDLRKVDYSDAVYPTLAMPTTLFAENAGKLAYRVRPRYNSEYLTNVGALGEIGALSQDYHTKKMWIQIP